MVATFGDAAWHEFLGNVGAVSFARQQPLVEIREMRLACTMLLLVGSSICAQQGKFDNYDEVRDDVFWPMLYSIGGESLYCAALFEAGQRIIGGRELTVEHVYSVDWIATHHGCETGDVCNVSGFRYAEADLHNLWPALRNINSSRQDVSFGEIPGEEERQIRSVLSGF